MSSPLKILGIETSCDETAAAIVTSDKKILANIVLSQLDEHCEYGGVVPEIAARAHLEYLENIVQSALSEAKLGFADLDAIAVTAGPGLIGGVIVGLMAAKSYASVYKKPLLPINHLEGHALTVRLEADIAFPYLLLLVSGGHCEVLVAESLSHYRVLGRTLDDALGEAFDKVAKMLGLEYPGGPKIEQRAALGNAQRFQFPKPLLGRQGCDFSFSGLKTAVRLQLQALENVSEADKNDIAASFQHTVTEILQDRLRHALEIFCQEYPQGKFLVLAGGVAANQTICKALEKLALKYGLQLASPSIALCTDNAAMIAWAGAERMRAGILDKNALMIEPRARWPLSELL